MYSDIEQLKLISKLLHEAKLQNVVWDDNSCQLSCYFDCLRLNADGSKLQDTIVEIRFTTIRKIAAYYSPANFEIRPSQILFDSPITFPALNNWNKIPTEVVFSINSEQSLFDMQTSWRCDWLLQDKVELAQIKKPFAHLHFELKKYDANAVQENLYIEFEVIEICSSKGSPLTLKQWEEEHQAFWDGWRSYWSKQSQPEYLKNEKDKFNSEIVTNEINPYQNSSPFDINNPIVPDYLLLPIRQFHFGLHQADWKTVAKVWPNFDQTNDERARIHRDFMQDSLFYLRSIDPWWEEGNMSCVKIRGVQYWPSDEYGPAKEGDVVVSYGLRKADVGWVIFTLSIYKY